MEQLQKKYVLDGMEKENYKNSPENNMCFERQKAN